jgi:hypothetical protein
MAKITVLFEFEKDTKPNQPGQGAIRFKEVDTDGNTLTTMTGVVGTVYVRKAKLPDGGVPKKLKAEFIFD